MSHFPPVPLHFVQLCRFWSIEVHLSLSYLTALGRCFLQKMVKVTLVAVVSSLPGWGDSLTFCHVNTTMAQLLASDHRTQDIPFVGVENLHMKEMKWIVLTLNPTCHEDSDSSFVPRSLHQNFLPLLQSAGSLPSVCNAAICWWLLNQPGHLSSSLK